VYSYWSQTSKVKMKGSLLLLLLCSVIMSPSSGFVKSLLKPQPMIETMNEIWSKSLPNVAVYRNLTLSLARTLRVPTPSYVQTLQNNILSITSFSLLRKGAIMQFDLSESSSSSTSSSSSGSSSVKNKSGSIGRSQDLKGDYLWPNELTLFHDKENTPIMLVPDGFLMPGQSDGGLYAIKNPDITDARPVRITSKRNSWFYHRAVHVRFPGGHEGIITARAHKPLFGKGRGELVWLTIPDVMENTPWTETVIASGPDVMFEVLDINKSDDTVEVISAHFFDKKISVHSIRAVPKIEPNDTGIETFCRMEMRTEGRPYGLCLAKMTDTDSDSSTSTSVAMITNEMKTLQGKDRDNRQAVLTDTSSPTHLLVSTHECSYDIPAALSMAGSALLGKYPRVRTSAGLQVSDQGLQEGEGPENGGALFAYTIPDATDWTSLPRDDITPNEMPTTANASPSRMPWLRQTMFRGFKVRGWGGIFSPGAPGFPYVFRMPNKPQAPPLILLAGDCTGSAYIFAPKKVEDESICREGRKGLCGMLPTYELAFEVECGATVGSACVSAAPDGSGDVDVFVPSYELDQVHVLRLSDQD
jgi:hypothetical protein